MKILNKITNHKYISGALVLIVLIAGASAIANNAFKKSSDTNSDSALTKVILLNVKDYQKNQVSVSSNGIVESLQQADLRSQVNAPVSSIKVSIGDKVYAGQVLVTLQNTDLNAQLSQAKASLRAQQANLEQMKKGTRTEELNLAKIRVDTAKQTLEDTKTQQDLLVKNAYQTLLNSSVQATPTKSFSAVATVSGTYTGIEQGKYDISVYLTSNGYYFNTNGLESASGPVSNKAVPMGDRGLYISFSGGDLNGTEKWTVEIPNTKAAGYLTYYNNYQNSLTAKETAINAATSALESAESSLALAVAGATAEQIESQEAVVEAAQATIENISAQIDKTIIRSPISGTVSSLSAKYGELITVGSSIASVVNESGLQVKSYVSDKDLPLIEKGADVIIGDGIKGKVDRLSPSVDTKTKTAEVNILVSEPEKSNLIIGQNVTVKITGKNENTSTSYLLPLQAVKITNDSAYIYQVSNDSILEEKQVTLGDVDGEFIEIKAGIEPEMKIVSAVYELRNGQKVIIEQ